MTVYQKQQALKAAVALQALFSLASVASLKEKAEGQKILANQGTKVRNG